jgi:hypothetical protein
LTIERPFADIKSEAWLCSKLHQDHRPNLAQLPLDTPKSVIRMITDTWHKDRYKRRSAMECYAILYATYEGLIQSQSSSVFGNEIIQNDFEPPPVELCHFDANGNLLSSLNSTTATRARSSDDNPSWRTDRDSLQA